MQEEIEHKTVNFAISTVKLSARTLLKGAQFFLRQYDKSASQGKQSMKRLIRQNRGVTNLEIEKTGIKDFDRYAKRYHIDYAIQKDLSCTPPRFLIFFKAQDPLTQQVHRKINPRRGFRLLQTDFRCVQGRFFKTREIFLWNSLTAQWTF